MHLETSSVKFTILVRISSKDFKVNACSSSMICGFHRPLVTAKYHSQNSNELLLVGFYLQTLLLSFRTFFILISFRCKCHKYFQFAFITRCFVCDDLKFYQAMPTSRISSVTHDSKVPLMSL